MENEIGNWDRKLKLDIKIGNWNWKLKKDMGDGNWKWEYSLLLNVIFFLFRSKPLFSELMKYLIYGFLVICGCHQINFGSRAVPKYVSEPPNID